MGNDGNNSIKSHWYTFLLESTTFTIESTAESTHSEIPEIG